MLTYGSRILNLLDQHREVIDTARAAIPGVCEGEPLFHAPWQARIFALIVALVKKNHFPWKTFQEQLVAAIKQNNDGVNQQSAQHVEQDYFDSWLAAAEETLKINGFLTDDDVAEQIKQIRLSVKAIRDSQLGHQH